MWYDVYLRIKPSLTEVVKIARDYVTATRLSIPPEEDGPFVIDYEETEKDKAYIPCSNSRVLHKQNKNKNKECGKCVDFQCLQLSRRISFCSGCSGLYHSNFLSRNTCQSINLSVEYDHPEFICIGKVITRDS